MPSDAIYVGNGKWIETKHGDAFKLMLHKDDLGKIIDYMDDNRSQFVSLFVSERRQPSAKGWTHSMKIDTWKPDKTKSGSNESNAVKMARDAFESNDQEEIPF